MQGVRTLAIFAFAAAAGLAMAQQKPPPAVHLIWMGGNDCPPCKAWRMTELPKLEKSAEFQAVKFTYVEKLIGSPVPPSIFMPSEVKPYKDQLDEASGGVSGSPQCAVIVDGKVYDYWHGIRNAGQIEKMLVAIRTGKGYPFKRCVKYDRKRVCQVFG